VSATLTIVADNRSRQAFAEMQSDTAKLAGSMDKVDDELKQAAKSAQKLKTETKTGFSGMSMQVTGFNQALEIGKKGVEAVTHAVLALEAEGNPAAKELTESFGELYRELVAIGDDPVIIDTMRELAGVMKNDVIPQVAQVPTYLDALRRGMSGLSAVAGEFTGFMPEGTVAELARHEMGLSAIHDRQLAINREARQTALVYGRITDIENKMAAESEQAAIGQLKDQRTLQDLLDDEIKTRQELAEAGELSGKKLEDSDKKVEAIKRRLISLAKEQADAEIKAAADASAARAKSLEEFQGWVKETEAAAKEAREIEKETIQAAKDAAVAELQKAIGEAQSILQPGKGLLEGLRGQVSGKDVEKSLIDQRRGKAREDKLEELRGKGMVDQDGKAIGETTAERQKNQLALNRQLANAENEAERNFRRQASRGGLDAGEVRSARDALVLRNAEQGGLKGTRQFDALSAQMQQEQQAFAAQQEQQRELQRLQVAAASPKEQKRFEALRGRAQRRTGGTSQAAEEQALQEFTRTASDGNQAVSGFAQTTVQGFGQLTAQTQMLGTQVNTLQKQLESILQGNANAANRKRSQGSSL
jgi:hypothetical protein